MSIYIYIYIIYIYIYNIKMNKNKIRYCTLLLINDYNDYNIKDDNESIRVINLKILEYLVKLMLKI